MDPLTLKHWRGFSEFSALDKEAGGCDSHMKTVAALSTGQSREERAWRAAIYAGGFYNAPTAEAVWSCWSWDRARSEGTPTVAAWLGEHWAGLGFRRERRAVRTVRKMGEFLVSLREWVPAVCAILENPTTTYDDLWRTVNDLKYVGRYGGIKLLETMRQMCLTDKIIPDIRAKGGWSPREGLALLYPEHSAWLTNTAAESAEDTARVEHLAKEAQRRSAEEFGITLDNYEFQVFLCDYKQCVAGRQYPGRSLDSELEYAAKVQTHEWGAVVRSAFFPTRRLLFPEWALGELSWWSGVRGELGQCWTRYGYMWTDKLYDYPESTPALPRRRLCA
jgi:hypothetical protein